ncbi:MAG: tRNA (adenosine(37)-N6)-dimethylallyltransferase MiaA, partial [Hyphomicrobiales bacterium]|nr:tRNA (adenosine(37)-N6)-dimethylallyltransferase MiaA [Hyphomicrobiales bacterium]
QVYQQLRIVTARPDEQELMQCPHLLYGHRDGRQPYSVALWLGEAAKALEQARRDKKTPIFVGGTGLYFKSLTEGLSPVPVLDPVIRQKWRDFMLAKSCAETDDGQSLYQELTKRDPAAAKQLRPSDHQRLIRALEVIDSTGKSILEWQAKDKGKALITGKDVQKIVLMPERSQLHVRINERFDKMVLTGAPEEVKQFLGQNVDPTLPIMKAIGVPQFAKFLSGDISMDEAVEKAKAATRQYAKRQSTWFNNQFGNEWQRKEYRDFYG